MGCECGSFGGLRFGHFLKASQRSMQRRNHQTKYQEKHMEKQKGAHSVQGVKERVKNAIYMLQLYGRCKLSRTPIPTGRECPPSPYGFWRGVNEPRP